METKFVRIHKEIWEHAYPRLQTGDDFMNESLLFPLVRVRDQKINIMATQLPPEISHRHSVTNKMDR